MYLENDIRNSPIFQIVEIWANDVVSLKVVFYSINLSNLPYM